MNQCCSKKLVVVLFQAVGTGRGSFTPGQVVVARSMPTEKNCRTLRPLKLSLLGFVG